MMTVVRIFGGAADCLGMGRNGHGKQGTIKNARAPLATALNVMAGHYSI